MAKINWVILAGDVLPCVDGSLTLVRILHTTFVDKFPSPAPFCFLAMEFTYDEKEEIEEIAVIVKRGEETVLSFPAPFTPPPPNPSVPTEFMAFCVRFGGYEVQEPCRYQVSATLHIKGKAPIISPPVDYMVQLMPQPIPPMLQA